MLRCKAQEGVVNQQRAESAVETNGRLVRYRKRRRAAAYIWLALSVVTFMDYNVEEIFCKGVNIREEAAAFV